MGNHDRVVDHSAVSLTNRLHDRVVDHSRASFVDGTTNGVVDHLFVCLVNRLHDRVVDDLAVRLVHRLHNGIVNLLGVRLVHRSSDVVGHLSSVCLVDRLAYNTVDSSVTCLSLHASDIDYLVFCHRLVLSSRTLHRLLFVNRASYCLHDRVASWNFTAIDHTATTIFIANRSAICGISFARYGSQHGDQYRYHEQPSHLPFSFENFYVYWVSIWWTPGAPWC